MLARISRDAVTVMRRRLRLLTVDVCDVMSTSSSSGFITGRPLLNHAFDHTSAHRPLLVNALATGETATGA